MEKTLITLAVLLCYTLNVRVLAFKGLLENDNNILKEGESRIFYYMKFDGNAKCRLIYPSEGSTINSNQVYLIGRSNDDSIIDSKSHFKMNDKSSTATFTVKVFESEEDELERKLIISIICKDLEYSVDTIDKLEFIIPGSNSYFHNGDPDFMQIVFDEKFKQFRHICYNIPGKLGDKFLLYTDKVSKILIHGIFFDEYLMHKIDIMSKYGNISAHLGGVHLWKGLFVNWNDDNLSQVIKENQHFLIQMEENKFHIKLIDERNITFTIERLKKPLGKFYLNIVIRGIEEDYKKFGGLISKIGSNKFQFYREVNDILSKDEEKIAIGVNGRLGYAIMQKRDNQKCWLINCNHGLYPSSVTNFTLKTH
ncbi:DgyrCDS3530 [Dimorphilus gyrociliatus]|uniref:DgyrCDS3530 n=1 Tax=Dimorphilus gyrociliatus TaxID=2664684 RepID=A0A7I8VE08_9ANNE|nr:DgyrCDS3530 [Dimorphilus gyrociliatus]